MIDFTDRTNWDSQRHTEGGPVSLLCYCWWGQGFQVLRAAQKPLTQSHTPEQSLIPQETGIRKTLDQVVGGQFLTVSLV